MWSVWIEGILPKGPYPPCLRMADRALLAGYPRCVDITKVNERQKLGPTFLHYIPKPIIRKYDPCMEVCYRT